ncbi:MAG: twin-arginine translocase TatA/TatE family subunit [Candidatus Spyradenecus sp.]
MSFLETLVILLVAVVVLGPKRLPEAARKVGHWMGVLRRASDEFKQQLMTMDQTLEKQVNAAVNTSTGELDNLLPTDEELAQAMDFAPPPLSPDDVLATAPVPGGLAPTPPPAEEQPAAEAPAEAPVEPAAEAPVEATAEAPAAEPQSKANA